MEKVKIIDEPVLLVRIMMGYNYDYEKHINSVVVGLNYLNNIIKG